VTTRRSSAALLRRLDVSQSAVGRLSSMVEPGGSDCTIRSCARAGWSSSSFAPSASERSAAVSARAASSWAMARCPGRDDRAVRRSQVGRQDHVLDHDVDHLDADLAAGPPRGGSRRAGDRLTPPAGRGLGLQRRQAHTQCDLHREVDPRERVGHGLGVGDRVADPPAERRGHLDRDAVSRQELLRRERERLLAQVEHLVRRAAGAGRARARRSGRRPAARGRAAAAAP
jgi:hypothetical protein